MTQILSTYGEDPLMVYIGVIGLASLVQQIAERHGPAGLSSELIEKIKTLIFGLQLSLPATLITVPLKRALVHSTIDSTSLLALLWSVWTLALFATYHTTRDVQRATTKPPIFV